MNSMEPFQLPSRLVGTDEAPRVFDRMPEPFSAFRQKMNPQPSYSRPNRYTPLESSTAAGTGIPFST
jgi:hypothetical protein